MQTYRIPMVPGPTSVSREVLAKYFNDYASADLEAEFFELYAATEKLLQTVLRTANPLAIMSGEAMVVLWGALRSVIKPGDRVLSVGTGVFGYGIGQMALSITDNVQFVRFDYDEAADPGRVEDAIRAFRPKLLTLVHCETPSGTLNSLADIGVLVRQHDVPLFYVDAVSSAAGAPLMTDEWNVDLCLVGTQKCLSGLPDLGIVSISERTWDHVKEVGYQGYDALAPWQTALADRWFPYTPNWQATAALRRAAEMILNEGLDAVLRRHAEAAALCRARGRAMGLELYPRDEAISSPTVTAFKVPARIGWPELDRRLRRRGLGVGGSLEKLAGKVFRVGHMGVQADVALVDQAMDVIADSLRA